MNKFLSAIIANMALAGSALAMGQQPGGAGQGGGSGIVGMLLPMVVVFAIFYLLLIRPQQKQQKKVKVMLESLQKGDNVITRGGIHGRIAGIADSIITLEIADNVKIKINREHIGVVKSRETAPDAK